MSKVLPTSPNLFEPEVRFAVALARFIKHFNLIDENVGLAIAYLEHEQCPKSSFESLAKMTSEQKLERLRELLEMQDSVQGDTRTAEYSRWLTGAHAARCMRNRYLHGHWEYLPRRKAKPIGLRPPAWMKEKWGPETMSIEEFETFAAQMERTFEAFIRFRNAHGI